MTSSQIETKSFHIIFILCYPVITGHCLINDMIKYKRTLSRENFSVVAFWQKLVQDIDNLTLHSFLRLRIVLPSNNEQLFSLLCKCVKKFLRCQLNTLFLIRSKMLFSQKVKQFQLSFRQIFLDMSFFLCTKFFHQLQKLLIKIIILRAAGIILINDISETLCKLYAGCITSQHLLKLFFNMLTQINDFKVFVLQLFELRSEFINIDNDFWAEILCISTDSWAFQLLKVRSFNSSILMLNLVFPAPLAPNNTTGFPDSNSYSSL